MTERENLSSEQLELLLDHRRMKREDKTPVLVSGRAVDAVREVLGASLRERGVNPDSLDLEALAGQFTTLEEEEIEETVTALGKQMPATGGQPAEESEPQASAEDRAEARDKIERADKMSERTPKHAEALRAEAADLLGRSVDDLEDIDLETL